jgi:hypothetical protein
VIVRRVALNGIRLATLTIGLFCYLAFIGCRDDEVPRSTSDYAEEQRPESRSSLPEAKVSADHQPAGQFSPGAIEWIDLARRKSDASAPLFETLDPKEIGMDFFNKLTRRQGQNRNNTTGSGVAMGDYDDDGLVDVFLARSTDGGRLYRNLGGFRFQDVSDEAGIVAAGRWTQGATFADVNNDGRLDLYVCGYGCPNHLYINNGDGTFSEKSGEAGVDFSPASIMGSFADFDRDGDLDLYLANNHFPPPHDTEYRLTRDRHGNLVVPPEYKQYHGVLIMDDGTPALIHTAQPDRLYRNNGDGTFTDITDDAGIADYAHGLSATWWDYDQDGWPDLYIANDFYAKDQLYHNNRDGTFVDVASNVISHSPWFSMGSDLGDINNDGLVDFIGTDMATRTEYRRKMSVGEIYEYYWFMERTNPRQYVRNAVYLNTGVGRMLEVAQLAGLDASNWTWSIRLEDLDQDGKIDAHITNGMTIDSTNVDVKLEALKHGREHSEAFMDVVASQPMLREANLVFRNLGEMQFEEVGKDWGLDFLGISFGAAFGDLDNDGDLDLVVNNLDDMVSVYRNNGDSGGAVRIRLKGTGSNRWGIGATVRAKIGEEVQTRYLTLARGFMSQSDPTVHFGVGKADAIDELTVDWPSGHRQSFDKLPVGRLYTITEPTGPVPPREVEEKPRPLFTASTALGDLKHLEKRFDDFARQPLLPFRLSQLGPGLALGDVDGNGREDLFLGAAKFDWGTLLLNDDSGKWSRAPGLLPPWSDDVQAEDMGVLLVDVDGDSDLDLYVVSGGVEYDAADPLLADRLYLNDGKGEFKKAPAGQLPAETDSGSVAAAADFDRDGDLDLFIGGRSIPGRFPETPASRLLVNDGKGTFADATGQFAPELAASGLVTSALWTDANGDGWIDLVVTHEWGPIKLYLNENGRLRDATDDAGLAKHHGWWNGVAGRDIDADGDIDYVVTNLGRNTNYRVSADRPARLYYGDLSGEGHPVLLEAKYDEEGRLVPAQNKPEVEKVLPFVAGEYSTFHAFASATLEEIVGAEVLNKAQQWQANTTDSVLLRNDGAGRFTIEPLPLFAQVSTGYGVVLSDFNGDGHTDAYLAQNCFSTRREHGYIDGGLSIFLAGDGKGHFEEVLPAESGLVVPGDAKSAAAADINSDNWPDLVVGVNNAELMEFTNQRVAGRRMASVRLRGRAGNPTAVGARVTLRRSDGHAQAAEVSAGGGYLSQQSPRLYFGLGDSASVQQIEVRWPDGSTTTHDPPSDATDLSLEIAQPGGN